MNWGITNRAAEWQGKIWGLQSIINQSITSSAEVLQTGWVLTWGPVYRVKETIVLCCLCRARTH